MCAASFTSLTVSAFSALNRHITLSSPGTYMLRMNGVFPTREFAIGSSGGSDRAGRRHIARDDAAGHTWLARKSSPSLFRRFERDLRPTLRRRALANQNAK